MATTATQDNLKQQKIDQMINPQSQQQLPQQQQQQQNRHDIPSKQSNSQSKTSNSHSNHSNNLVFSDKSYKWMRKSWSCIEIHFILSINISSITNGQIYVLIDYPNNRAYPMLSINNSLQWNDKTITNINQLQTLNMNDDNFQKNKFVKLDKFMEHWYKKENIQTIFTFTVLDKLSKQTAMDLGMKLYRRWFYDDHTNTPKWVDESNLNQ